MTTIVSALGLESGIPDQHWSIKLLIDSGTVSDFKSGRQLYVQIWKQRRTVHLTCRKRVALASVTKARYLTAYQRDETRLRWKHGPLTRWTPSTHTSTKPLLPYHSRRQPRVTELFDRTHCKCSIQSWRYQLSRYTYRLPTPPEPCMNNCLLPLSSLSSTTGCPSFGQRVYDSVFGLNFACLSAGPYTYQKEKMLALYQGQSIWSDWESPMD